MLRNPETLDGGAAVAECLGEIEEVRESRVGGGGRDGGGDEEGGWGRVGEGGGVELGALRAAAVEAPVGGEEGGEAVDSGGGVEGGEGPGGCEGCEGLREGRGESGEGGGWVDCEGDGGGGEVHGWWVVGELWMVYLECFYGLTR